LTQAGQLFEFFPTAGSYSDTSRLELLGFGRQPEAQVFGN
jgi:hypothetical protein